MGLFDPNGARPGEQFSLVIDSTELELLTVTYLWVTQSLAWLVRTEWVPRY